MPEKITSKTHQNAHDFRREPTEAESKLWSRLRSHRLKDVHFRRQHPIGKYVVDICAPREKLIIEIDGSQHMSKEGKDFVRTHVLEAKGYRILRFWNHEVLNNIEDVVIEIERVLRE